MPAYDGRYELTFFYATVLSGLSLNHRLTIDFRPGFIEPPAPGSPFSAYSTTLGSGGSGTLDTAANDLLDLLLPFWRPTTEFSRVELWAYDAEPSTDKTFLSVMELAEPGTAAAGTDVAAQQETMTLRTVNGGIMRVQLMEPVSSLTSRQNPPFSPAHFDALRSYMVGLTHPWVGRDNSRPLAAIAWGSGQNEKLFRKRFRA